MLNEAKRCRHAEQREAVRGECGMLNHEVQPRMDHMPDKTPREVVRLIGTVLIAVGSVYTIANIILFVSSPFTVFWTRPGTATWDGLMEISPLFEGVATLAVGILILRHTRLLRRLVVLLIIATLFCNIAKSIAFYKLVSINTGLPVLWYVGMLMLRLPAHVACVAIWFSLRRMRLRIEATLDAPVCAQCSYIMRGLNEPRCPECGRVYTLDEFHAL